MGDDEEVVMAGSRSGRVSARLEVWPVEEEMEMREEDPVGDGEEEGDVGECKGRFEQGWLEVVWSEGLGTVTERAEESRMGVFWPNCRTSSSNKTYCDKYKYEYEENFT